MTTKVLIPRVQKDSSSSECSSSEVSIRTASTPGRKRKLDHLSVEEKIQRKKLKNRVAAQTSRDRKKKQMEEMVVTIEKYEKEVLHWKTKFNQLQTKYEKLEKENRKLKANQSSHKDINNNIVKREIVAHSIPEEHKYTRSFVEDTKIDDRCVDSVVIKSEGPAEGYEDENRVDTKVIEEIFSKPSERRESIIEGSATLPSLQELLEDIDLQFDLEELAESLVSELHSNIETDSSMGNSTNAKEESKQLKLSGSVVDEQMSRTTKSRMESAKDCHRSSIDDVQMNSSIEHDVQSDLSSETYSTDKIFYEDEIPVVEDECLEIDDTMEESDEICLKFTQTNMDRLISPIPDYDDLKSPHHAISDCGYESQGSPVSLNDFHSLNDPQDDLNYLLNDLFPALA